MFSITSLLTTFFAITIVSAMQITVDDDASIISYENNSPWLTGSSPASPKAPFPSSKIPQASRNTYHYTLTPRAIVTIPISGASTASIVGIIPNTPPLSSSYFVANYTFLLNGAPVGTKIQTNSFSLEPMYNSTLFTYQKLDPCKTESLQVVNNDPGAGLTSVLMIDYIQYEQSTCSSSLSSTDGDDSAPATPVANSGALNSQSTSAAQKGLIVAMGIGLALLVGVLCYAVWSWAKRRRTGGPTDPESYPAAHGNKLDLPIGKNPEWCSTPAPEDAIPPPPPYQKDVVVRVDVQRSVEVQREEGKVVGGDMS